MAKPTNQKSIRVMGVDPGTLVTGFGVIDIQGTRHTLVEYGIIKMKASWSMPLRLREIYIGLEDVIERTAPDEFAIESAFYSKNVQSTLKLGHARGVSILAAVLRQIPTSEYSPREIKKAVTGSGAATKEQVEYMVMTILSLTERHDFFDATDALAIALCHAGRLQRPEGAGGGKGDWKSFIAQNPDRVK
jgi:crossover junction endodeoxyribonuclease RuvC